MWTPHPCSFSCQCLKTKMWAHLALPGPIHWYPHSHHHLIAHIFPHLHTAAQKFVAHMNWQHMNFDFQKTSGKILPNAYSCHISITMTVSNCFCEHSENFWKHFLKVIHAHAMSQMNAHTWHHFLVPRCCSTQHVSKQWRQFLSNHATFVAEEINFWVEWFWQFLQSKQLLNILRHSFGFSASIWTKVAPKWSCKWRTIATMVTWLRLFHSQTWKNPKVH